MTPPLSLLLAFVAFMLLAAVLDSWKCAVAAIVALIAFYVSALFGPNLSTVVGGQVLHSVTFWTLMVVAYILIGALVVSAVAFVSAAGGGHWFEEGEDRWMTGDIAPLPVFILWPLAVVIGAVYYLFLGLFRGIEFLGNQANKAGVIRERKMRGELK